MTFLCFFFIVGEVGATGHTKERFLLLVTLEVDLLRLVLALVFVTSLLGVGALKDNMILASTSIAKPLRIRLAIALGEIGPGSWLESLMEGLGK